MDEQFDVLDEEGKKTGQTKNRKDVHRDGDWHRAVHVWIYVLDTQELLLQQRAECKESWPGLWDISAAGHVEAGQESLDTAHREALEELGIDIPKEALEFLFSLKLASTDHGGKFVNNEYDDVYLVTVKQRIPVEYYTLQKEEVQAVKYIHYESLEQKYRGADPEMAMHIQGDRASYGRFFDLLRARVKSGGLPGSGIVSCVHRKEGLPPAQIQMLTFDQAYLKLIPPEHR